MNLTNTLTSNQMNLFTESVSAVWPV